MLSSTVFHILLVVGVFLAAECRAEQPLEDESLHELQDEKGQQVQKADHQVLQDENPSQDEQELLEGGGDSLQNLDEDPQDDSDDVAQESQDEQEPSDARQVYRRRVVYPYLSGTGFTTFAPHPIAIDCRVA